MSRSKPDEGMPGLTLTDLLSGRDGGRIERYRAVLGVAEDAAIVAVGWGTVDVERTLHDLGHSTDSPAMDASLGAKGVMISAGDVTIFVLEPVTEGRLAASLARHGEGICALYGLKGSGGQHTLRSWAGESRLSERS